MSLNDPLANVLSALQNAERRGKKQVVTKHSSVLIKKVLDIMVTQGYLANYEVDPAASGETLTINLSGHLNETGVIKPRFQVKKAQFERFEKRFLPSKGFGTIIISTNQGLMTHVEAKEKGIGGTLISYVY
jgi:small subunit ribosomal protein S8